MTEPTPEQAKKLTPWDLLGVGKSEAEPTPPPAWTPTAEERDTMRAAVLSIIDCYDMVMNIKAESYDITAVALNAAGGMIAARARAEALRPIRALHRHGEYEGPFGWRNVLTGCIYCRDEWPCATARAAGVTVDTGESSVHSTSDSQTCIPSTTDDRHFHLAVSAQADQSLPVHGGQP